MVASTLSARALPPFVRALWAFLAFSVTVTSVLGQGRDGVDEGLDGVVPFRIQTSGVLPSDSQQAFSWMQKNTSWASSLLSVAVEWDVKASDIKAATDAGWHVMLTEVASPERRKRRHQIDPSKPIANLSRAMETLAANGIAGTDLTWEYITEDDSAGTSFPWDLMTLSRKAGYSNGATNLRPEDAKAAWQNYLAQAYAATMPWKKSRLHARLGFPQFLHDVAPTSDCVLVELANDDVGSFGPALAFLRGSAVQYNSTWGVDLSLWWGVIAGCVSDLPASLHRRIMALSYVAGASVVCVEDCGWINGNGEVNEIGKALDAFGSFVASGKLPPSSRGLPDASALGVALVLPSDLGWSERPSYAAAAPTLWSFANIPATSRKVAASVDGILSAAYPGAGGAFGFMAFPFGAFADEENPPASPFARSSVKPPYAPDPDDAFQASASPLPFGRFHDRNQLRKWFANSEPNRGVPSNQRGGSGAKDPAPHRPMVDSRWGDILDILVADEEGRWSDVLLQEETRSGYSVLVWANTTTSPAAAQALERFASKGASVVLAIGTVGEEHADLTGITPTGEVRAVRAWRWALGESEGDMERGYFSTSSISEADQANKDYEIVAVSEPGGAPIIIRKPVGSGWIYTCLVPYFGTSGLSPPALRLLDYLIGPVQTLRVLEGAPTLYWTSVLMQLGSHSDDSPSAQARVAAISNNADVEWAGKVRIKLDMKTLPTCSSVSCEDLWNGRKMSCSGVTAKEDNNGLDVYKEDTIIAADVGLSIDAHDLVIVKVVCSDSGEPDN